MTDNLADKIPWDKTCVDIIGSYKICIKVNKKGLILNVVMVIDPIMGWFEINRKSYNHHKLIRK